MSQNAVRECTIGAEASAKFSFIFFDFDDLASLS